MKLYIGGCYQGKLSYVSQMNGITQQDIITGKCITWEAMGRKKVCNAFHDFLRVQLSLYQTEKEATANIWDNIVKVLLCNPELIIVCDEVGMGIVPMDKEERDFREVVGRICILLAKEASDVERIICGIGQKLK